MTSKTLKSIDIEQMAKAIEADMGESLPDIRQAISELKEGAAGRVTTAEQIKTREARKALALTQADFATLIDTPLATLRDWEQGRFAPPGGVLRLFDLLIKHPELSREL